MMKASKNAITFAHVGVMGVKLTILTNTKKCTNAAIAPTAINHRACLDAVGVAGFLFIGFFVKKSSRGVRDFISMVIAITEFATTNGFINEI